MEASAEGLCVPALRTANRVKCIELFAAREFCNLLFRKHSYLNGWRQRLSWGCAVTGLKRLSPVSLDLHLQLDQSLHLTPSAHQQAQPRQSRRMLGSHRR